MSANGRALKGERLFMCPLLSYNYLYIYAVYNTVFLTACLAAAPAAADAADIMLSFKPTTMTVGFRYVKWHYGEQNVCNQENVDGASAVRACKCMWIFTRLSDMYHRLLSR